MTRHFTNGPWAVGGWFGDVSREIVAAEGSKVIGRVTTHARAMPGEERQPLPNGSANARLIAEAPNLVDALENLIIGIGMGWDLDGLVESGNGVIARVRGEVA